MSDKQIIKTSKLHKRELKLIRKLSGTCGNHDGYLAKLHWSILENRTTGALNDILYFIGDKLVGYLALFAFELHEAEISAMVHPEHRRCGIFKQLFAEALLAAKIRRFKSLVAICPKKALAIRHYLEHGKTDCFLQQIQMITTEVPKIPVPRVQLVVVETSDIPIIAKMGAQCFKSTYDENLQRFSSDYKEPNRRIFLLSTTDHPNIGKIHVRYEEDRSVFIHDLCILPKFRGKKYALAMLVNTMQLLHKKGHRVFMLDVECNNPHALILYQKCGFKESQAYDHLRIKMKDVAI